MGPSKEFVIVMVFIILVGLVTVGVLVKELGTSTEEGIWPYFPVETPTPSVDEIGFVLSNAATSEGD